MAADWKFYTQQPTKNMRKLKRMKRVGGESGGDCGLWGVCDSIVLGVIYNK